MATKGKKGSKANNETVGFIGIIQSPCFKMEHFKMIASDDGDFDGIYQEAKRWYGDDLFIRYINCDGAEALLEETISNYPQDRIKGVSQIICAPLQTVLTLLREATGQRTVHTYPKREITKKKPATDKKQNKQEEEGEEAEEEQVVQKKPSTKKPAAPKKQVKVVEENEDEEEEAPAPKKVPPKKSALKKPAVEVEEEEVEEEAPAPKKLATTKKPVVAKKPVTAKKPVVEVEEEEAEEEVEEDEPEEKPVKNVKKAGK